MIEGRMVPKSQWIEIGVWAVHHNPEVWSDPETFDPDRFSPENKAKQTPFSYVSTVRLAAHRCSAPFVTARSPAGILSTTLSKPHHVLVTSSTPPR